MMRRSPLLCVALLMSAGCNGKSLPRVDLKGIRTIAIAPFLDRSNTYSRPEASGLAEWISGRIHGGLKVEVVEPAAVAKALKAANLKLADLRPGDSARPIAQQLKADAILLGSLDDYDESSARFSRRTVQKDPRTGRKHDVVTYSTELSARATVSIRLVRATDGEIVWQGSARGLASVGSINSSASDRVNSRAIASALRQLARPFMSSDEKKKENAKPEGDDPPRPPDEEPR